MKWRKGPRPWTIRAFATAFGAVALIGLFPAFSVPLVNWFLWAKRIDAFGLLGLFGGVPVTQDVGLVLACSMFTIALIPIVWIYGLGSSRAKWVVLVFGACKIGLWLQAWQMVGYGPVGQVLRFFEPILITAALALLFSTSAGDWLNSNCEADNETFA